MKLHGWILGTLLLVAGLMRPGLVSAVSIGQTDNFEDGTTQNWVVGILGANPDFPPVNVPTGGPAGDGDHYLLLTSVANDFGKPGNRLVVINQTQWTGSFPGVAVNFIIMDVNNLGATDLDLRIRVADPEAGPSHTPTHVAVSTDAVFVPAGSGWTRVVFPMGPDHFTPLKGDVATALGNVAELRIYHSPTAAFPGPTIDAQLGVDNIAARVTSAGPPADYDGDGKTDIAVWRPADGNWYIRNSQTGTVTVQQWGAPTDILVPGDYDGDGTTDIAVWRPAEGNWYILNSSTLPAPVTVQQWGTTGDVPVAGDYDGDGKADIAVWRPAEGNWYIRNSQTGTVAVQQWGTATDTPVVGRW